MVEEPMVARRCDVIIPTRDRPHALLRCLDGLRRQSTDDFGVIVVDDASAEPALHLLQRGATEGLTVTVVTMPAPVGPAAARNAGVARSRAQYVIFLDDDVVPDRYAVETHLAAVSASTDPRHPNVSCGPFVQPADWTPTPWNLWEARQAKKEADHVMDGTYPVTWRLFHTGNNCMPRATFVELGGFDVSFTRAEDDELALRADRLGCRFRYEQGSIAWHYSNRSLAAWLSIPEAYAHYDVELARRDPSGRWLAQKRAERASRRVPLRAARRALAGRRRGRPGARVAVTAARVLYRLGFTDLSMGALSVAYDVSYTTAFRRDLAAADEGPH